MRLELSLGPFFAWVLGWPLIGVFVGLLGLRFPSLRWPLAFVGPPFAVAAFLLFIALGGLIEVGPLGIAILVAVTIASFAPVASWLAGTRTPSIAAAALLVVLMGWLAFVLVSWFPAGAGVLAAAIAGPPPRGHGRRPSVAGDDDLLDALH